jgi:hypothetical protein
VKNYKLIIEFHAENDEDAANQTRLALEGFDDGYECHTLLGEREPPYKPAVDRKVKL